MGRIHYSTASPGSDAGKAHATTTSLHVDNNLPPTSSWSARGFLPSPLNTPHQSHSRGGNATPVADFSASRQPQGGPTHEQPSVPSDSSSYIQGYGDGFYDGYCKAMSSSAAVAQAAPPFVPVAPSAVPSPSLGAELQPYASPTFFHSATYMSYSTSYQSLPNTDVGPVVDSQVPGWGSEHLFQTFGRSRNSPTLHTTQFGASSVASTSAPQAPMLLASPTHSLIIVSQTVPGSQGNSESHGCTKCNKSFRRKYLLDDHLAWVHHRTKRHTCPAEGCGLKYVAHTGMMKHVNQKHPGLVVMPATSVDDVD